MLIISIAWKNIWRKPSRSMILIVTIAVGLMGGLFLIALTEGVIKQRNQELIDTQYSHIQIHKNKDYSELKIHDSIDNIFVIQEKFKEDENIQAVSARFCIVGVANSSRATHGVKIVGINPKKEKKVTIIHNSLLDTNSRYIGQSPNNETIVSSRIAQKLQLVIYNYDLLIINKIRKKINLNRKILEELQAIPTFKTRQKVAFRDTLNKYLSAENYEKYADIIINFSIKYKLNKKIILQFNNINGDIVEEAFKIVGIYETNDAVFDNVNIFANKEYITQLTELQPNTSNEMAIKVNSIGNVKRTAKKISTTHKNIFVQTYSEIDPLGTAIIDFIYLFYNILLVIILFALSFGIVNTVLMSILERKQEFKMLVSVGMSKIKIFSMIIYESIFLTFAGGLTGLLSGLIIINFLSRAGIDMSLYSNALSSFGANSTIYPSINILMCLNVLFLIMLTGILSAIYPAIRTLKIIRL